MSKQLSDVEQILWVFCIFFVCKNNVEQGSYFYCNIAYVLLNIYYYINSPTILALKVVVKRNTHLGSNKLA